MHRSNPYLALVVGFCLTLFAFAPDPAAADVAAPVTAAVTAAR